MMERITLIAVLAGLMIVGSVMLTKADVDGNCDGWIDLQDYAIMQNEFTGPGCCAREVVSFYAEGCDEFVVIPEVPGMQGFVLTDVVTQRAFPVTKLTFIQETGDLDETRLSIVVGASGDQTDRGESRSYHFNAGIPFAQGSTVKIVASNSNAIEVTLAGYVH
jgi:hypothetical protein